MGQEQPVNGEVMATNVKKRRLDRAWSQEELATISDLNVRTIQRIENGARASLETMKSLAAALDTTVAELTGQKPAQTKEAPVMTNQNAASYHRTHCHTPEGRKRSFRHHLAIYLAVIAGLACIDLVTSPDHLWVQWPAIGWGIGVALQGVRTYLPPEE